MPIVQSLKRIVNHLSLKHKLFILLLALSIVPIYLVSFSSEYFMLRSSTSYSASISKQYVQFVAKEMSDYLDNLNQSFDNVIVNQQFQKYANALPNQLAEQADSLMQFRPTIRNALQFHPEVLGILYLDRLGKVYFESDQKRLDPSYSFAGDSFYTAFFDTNKPHLTPPHPIPYIAYSRDRVFSYVRPVVNTDTGETMSWLIFEIREDKFIRMLGGNKETTGGQLTLYDEASGTAVSSEPLQLSILDDFRSTVLSQSALPQHVFFTSAGVEYEASFAQLSSDGWMLIWTAPLSRIQEGVKQTYYLTLLIAAVSLGVALIIAFPVMGGILRPLYKLQKGMQYLGRGKYVPIPETRRSDEIGFLVQNYNQTLDKLQQMEREVYQAKMKEKERELLQLQAQINPHFLFNTLETIESYAVRNNGEAVGDMVQSVSRMMRYTVRNDDGWAPLKEEIDYIRHFMMIHYYRNGQDVNAQFDIDPAAMTLPVMKLSIQPYIENALKYGWSPHMSQDAFLLQVEVRIAEQHLRIQIRNTGGSIPENVLDKLQHLIETRGETNDPFFRKHTGIYNAYRRLVIVYGEQAYFHIVSNPQNGTHVELHIPLELRGPDL